MVQGHQYETVSGFVCEAFGYIPRTGETIKVVLEREKQEDHHVDYDVPESERQDENEKTQIFKLEVCFEFSACLEPYHSSVHVLLVSLSYKQKNYRKQVLIKKYNILKIIY